MDFPVTVYTQSYLITGSINAPFGLRHYMVYLQSTGIYNNAAPVAFSFLSFSIMEKRAAICTQNLNIIEVISSSLRPGNNVVYPQGAGIYNDTTATALALSPFHAWCFLMLYQEMSDTL